MRVVKAIDDCEVHAQKHSLLEKSMACFPAILFNTQAFCPSNRHMQGVSGADVQKYFALNNCT
jgi:hypothetical protein